MAERSDGFDFYLDLFGHIELEGDGELYLSKEKFREIFLDGRGFRDMKHMPNGSLELVILEHWPHPIPPRKLSEVENEVSSNRDRYMRNIARKDVKVSVGFIYHAL